MLLLECVSTNVICLATEHQRAIGACPKVSVHSRSSLTFQVLVFVKGGGGGGGTGESGAKPLEHG